jgi:hypothetical protein
MYSSSAELYDRKSTLDLMTARITQPKKIKRISSMVVFPLLVFILIYSIIRYVKLVTNGKFMLNEYSKIKYYAGNTFMVICFVFAVFFLLSVDFYIDKQTPRVIQYDCSIAEISPDYPVQVKEDCRALMRHNYTKRV